MQGKNKHQQKQPTITRSAGTTIQIASNNRLLFGYKDTHISPNNKQTISKQTYYHLLESKSPRHFAIARYHRLPPKPQKHFAKQQTETSS